MQKGWIGKQTDLLALQEEIDGAQDHVQDQKNRKLILTQKRIRTEAGWDGASGGISGVGVLPGELDVFLYSLQCSKSWLCWWYRDAEAHPHRNRVGLLYLTGKLGARESGGFGSTHRESIP